MAANNLLDEMIHKTEPVSTNVDLNMPLTLDEIILQNYPQQQGFYDLDEQNRKAKEEADEMQKIVMELVEGVTTGNIPLPIGKVLWRGISKWFPGSMVKGGKFVGGGKWVDPKGIHGGGEIGGHAGRNPNVLFTTGYKGQAETAFNKGDEITKLLKFDVPEDYIAKHGTKGLYDKDIYFEEGLPKQFFKKVYDVALDIDETPAMLKRVSTKQSITDKLLEKSTKEMKMMEEMLSIIEDFNKLK